MAILARCCGAGVLRPALAALTAFWLLIGTDGGAVLRYRDGRFTTFTSDDGPVGQVVPRIDEADNGE